MSALDQLSAADLSSLDQGGDLWNLYRQACAESMYFFTKAVWSMVPPERNAMTRQCHLPLCLLAEDESLTRILYEYPRKYMKSSIITVARPNHRLARMVVRGEDPNRRFAIYSNRKTNAMRKWGTIKRTYETNELFQFLFPELIPDFSDQNKSWNKEEGTVPRLYNPDEPTYDCLGQGGSATSRHYDDICVDDLINEENFDEPDQVEKMLEMYRLMRGLLEDDRSTLCVVGNRWTMADLNHKIHMEEPDTAILSVSAYGPNLEGKYRCRLLPDPVMEILHRMPEGEPIWPERFNREQLGRLLLELKPRIFSAQFLNNPTDPDAVDFKWEWIKNLESRYENGEINLYFGDDKVPVRFQDCNLYITWDPALDGRHSDSDNAIIVSLMDPLGRIAVFDEVVRKVDPLVAMNDVLMLAERYKGFLKATGLEEVLFQKVLGKLLSKQALKNGIFLGIRPLKTPTGLRKDQRIRAWVGALFEDGLVYVHPRCSKFLEQYSTFGVPDAKRDAIDAFAYATQLWARPQTKEEEDDRDEREMETAFNSLGVTGYGTALRVIN
jgi:hypothetical protein